ncbi:Uncharacterised protein [Legionella wadsworthii]|uniref:Uncharacterized protein n=1 Tax=Legionella wadsworthii TaxID=28088 RepID=A0A378LW09_9GAMM|nr:hypothetical protein [Legionella wadsworthii]STY28251.1 Uncharacterised protein [Legionella wadsworthii]
MMKPYRVSGGLTEASSKLYSYSTKFFFELFMPHSTEHHKLNNKAGFAQAFACFFYFSFFIPQLGGGR